MKPGELLARVKVGRTGPAELLGLVCIGLFMASIAAFGDLRHDTLLRYAYWLTVLVGGGLIGALIEPWLWRIAFLAKRPVLLALAQILAMTPPVTLLVWLVSGSMNGMGFNPVRYLLLLSGVAVVNVGVVALAWLVRQATREVGPRPSETAPPEAIRQKLPPKLARSGLIAVEAEDHYLRIHTDDGDALILMRLSDAMEALKDRPGLQTHRSWWVARDAVDHVRWTRGRGELTLRNGLKAPVSRANAAAVRETDWAAG